MCGIFGVVSSRVLSDRESSKIARLSMALEHRGPDGSGLIQGSSYFLGMHRLSVMGIVEGQQPFWDASDR